VNVLSRSELIKYIVSEFRRFFNSGPEVVSSAPGRIDFLNTHQDYKGLPVVSIGIDLRTYIAVSRIPGRKSRIISINLLRERRKYMDSFNVDNIVLRNGKWFGNYIRSSVKALKEIYRDIDGFNALIYSDVPVAAGLASSAALLVSFIGAMSELYGFNLSKKDIAELAFHAEHDIMGIPCGRLDQYGSSFGGILKIETRPPYNVEELPILNGVFIVLDSGIRHSTADIHPRRQAEINEGLRILLQMNDLKENIMEKLSDKYYAVKWDEIKYEELLPYMMRLPDTPRRRIEFTLKMHESTLLALNIIRGNIPDLDKIVTILGSEWRDEVERALNSDNPGPALIGVIMNYQHVLLRDLYDVSLPELERIRNAALAAGALGVKLSGAGLGGSLTALAKDLKDAENILGKGLENGAKRGWIVKVDTGLRREL